MPRRKKKKKQTKGIRKRYLVLFIVALVFVGSGAKEIVTHFEITSNIATTKKETEKLKKEKAALKKEKENLSDPDYVEYMARGKYLVSKEGEQVFKFPSFSVEE